MEGMIMILNFCLSLFYLLFISTTSNCADLLKIIEMLFQLTLMKYDTHQFIQTSAFLGPFCSALFIFLSMFITIIIDNFRHARKNINNDKDIFSFMFDKFQRWIGF